jgi:NAD-dependent deacetylase
MGCVITQNIDGLHSLAGSQNVIELHGTIHRNYCMDCQKEYSLEYIRKSKGIPKCTCGGIIRPDVVLYGESLHDGVFEACYDALKKTDLLIVAGTGLTVSTASGVASMFRGKHLVILNNEPTAFDHQASLVINYDLIEVFQKLLKEAND